MISLPPIPPASGQVALKDTSDEDLAHLRKVLHARQRFFKRFVGTSIPGISVSKDGHSHPEKRMPPQPLEPGLPPVLTTQAAAQFPALGQALERFRALLVTAREYQESQAAATAVQLVPVEWEHGRRGWKLLYERFQASPGDLVFTKNGAGFVAEDVRVSLKEGNRLSVDVGGTRVLSSGGLGKVRHTANLEALSHATTTKNIKDSK